MVLGRISKLAKITLMEFSRYLRSAGPSGRKLQITKDSDGKEGKTNQKTPLRQKILIVKKVKPTKRHHLKVSKASKDQKKHFIWKIYSQRVHFKRSRDQKNHFIGKIYSQRVHFKRSRDQKNHYIWKIYSGRVPFKGSKDQKKHLIWKI